MVLSALSFVVAPQAERPEVVQVPVPLALFLVVAVVPWLETLLMWLTLALLGIVLRGATSRALACALVWAVLHSISVPVWGIIVFWPFFVFSTAFLEWQKKSTWKAIAVAALIHMCQNSIGLITLALFALSRLTRSSESMIVLAPPTDPAEPSADVQRNPQPKSTGMGQGSSPGPMR
ncbi:MAG: hypothetical protein NTW86_17445 [Candidatus Sumerlaeota bacterium]|nr:hypothetical protein [Candidatus Sumerlaeota bacterium]